MRLRGTILGSVSLHLLQFARDLFESPNQGLGGGGDAWPQNAGTPAIADGGVDRRPEARDQTLAGAQFGQGWKRVMHGSSSAQERQ